MVFMKNKEIQEHYHCVRCGKVLKEKPRFENKMSYVCDDCLVGVTMVGK